ncbi:MAG: DUF1569 domain-containing protein [Pseudomonadota bacterium]
MIEMPHLVLKSEGPLPVPALVERLTDLDPERASFTAPWSLARTFHHLAQGVEFSVQGYPELKPRVFRATLGRGAFHLFHRKGAMRHATDAVIPGEAVQDGDPVAARDRLVAALLTFEDTDALHPHFAFGTLSKPHYAAAHGMHVADHLHECCV